MFRFLLLLLLSLTLTTVYSDDTQENLEIPDEFVPDDVTLDDINVLDADDNDDDDDDDDGEGSDVPIHGEQMSFSQPSLTEEEQKSHHFPHRYRCDACQIIVHNLGSDFSIAESKIPKKRKKRTLGDVEVIELVEEVCSKDKFKDYSIQDFGGQVTFKGPAFPDRKEAGMSMGGGMWPVRYTNYCGSVFEDIEEDEAYDAYRNGELFEFLCLDRDCKGILDSTPDILKFRPGKASASSSAKEEL